MVEQEMVKVEIWILYLIDEETNLPRFYYNRIENIFETIFSNQCAFLDEKSSLDEQEKLNIIGVEVVKGTMDYPKDLLTSTILETFLENGIL